MPHPNCRRPGRGTFSAAADLRARTRAGWALALLLVPLPLLAQATPGSVEVGVGGGRFLGGTLAKGSNRAFDTTVGVDQNPTGGFWLGAQLSPEWGVEFAYRRTATEVIEHQSGLFSHQRALAGLDVASIEVLAIRSFRYGNFLPYLGAGVGLTNLDLDAPDPSLRDSNRGALSLTGGACFYLARWLGIRIDVRERATYLGARSQGQDHGWLDTGRWFFNTELTGGVFASFGGK
jgi:hypothetical protein